MASGTGTASDPRIYDIATETANGAVNDDMLKDEINVGGLSVAFSYLGTADGLVSCVFAAALSGADITALDAIVLAHQGLAMSPAFRMWESNAAQQTALETYVNAISQTPATSLLGGAYRIMWYFELRVVVVGPLNSKAQARITFNSTVVGNAASEDVEWVGFSGWDRIAGLPDGALPTMEIDFRREPTVGGNDNVEIRRLKMSFEKMG